MNKIATLVSMVVAAISPLCAAAQQPDSLPTVILSDLVITGTKTDADTIQLFYQNSKFVGTESLLGKLSGFSLVRRGAYGEDPVIRGLGSGQISVTVDGMRVFGACTDRMDPVSSYIDATNLSAAEGIADVSASAFGSTFGGAVNLVLQKPHAGTEKLSGIAGVQFGSAARSLTTYAVVNAGRRSSGYRVGFNHRKANEYRAGGGVNVRYSQYEKIQVAAGGKWSVGSGDTLTAEAIFDDGWNIGFPALPMDVGNARGRIYSLTFERANPGRIFHNFKVKTYHNRITHTMDDSARPDVIIPMDMPGSSFTSGVFAESDVHIFHEHPTTMKLEYFINTSSAEMIMYPAEGNPMYMQSAPESTSQTTGYFLQQRFTLSEKGKLTFTFRADAVSQHLHAGPGRRQWEVMNRETRSEVFEVLTTSGVSFSSKPSRNTHLSIEASYGERTPTNQERFGYYLFNRYDGYDYLGDPALAKESALNSEATWRWYIPGLELAVTPYYKRIDNYIFGSIRGDLSTMTPGARGVKQYTNEEYANISGADVMILARPVPSLQWITTVKYTQGNIAGGEPLPLMPPLKIISSLYYALKMFNMQMDVEYAGAQSRISQSFGEESTPAFWVVGLRGGWKPNEQWTLNAGIENLFDRHYREHLDWGGIPRPGRNVYLNVAFRY